MGRPSFLTTKYDIQKTRDMKEYLSNRVPMQSDKLKVRLIKEGYLDEQCATCGQEEWNNKTIPLQLSHKNGNPNDNRLANLELLCHNCHAHTREFRVKNEHRANDANVDHSSPNTDT